MLAKSVEQAKALVDNDPVGEPMDISDPLERYAAQLRNLLLKGMADRPFAEWPRLVKRLREEIKDVERSFGRLRADRSVAPLLYDGSDPTG